MAAQPPPESYIFDRFKGMRNTSTSERLAADELETARNVDIDDGGQVHRRRGYTRVVAGICHSLFESTHGNYLVKDGVLGLLDADYTFTTILAGMGPNPLVYVQVGDDVYFSSSTQSGVIHADGTATAWGPADGASIWVSPVLNPTATLGAVAGRLLGGPPRATAAAYFNGRIYLAHGRTVWATEPYLYNLVDKTRNFLPFEEDVTLVAAVADGLYVGTRKAVWFLSGTFDKMKRVAAMSSGALPGSAVTVPGEMMPPPLQGKDAVLFLTATGLCAGMDTGQCLGLTQGQMVFPDAQSVAAMFRRQDGVAQYIGVADSAGSPTATARIGDFVDAEIRRFQGV